MDLMEYQGKNLFRRLGVPATPQGEIAVTPAEAEQLARDFGVPVMVKAQVLTGGRGKAGGVRYASDPAEARAHAEAILGLDIKGHVVEKVLVEPASDIAEEYYLSVLHDRVGKGYKVIASVEGGVDIEEVNRTHPEKVVKRDVDPTAGLTLEQARGILAEARFPEASAAAASDLLARLYEGFVASDATLFEVNPLVRTTDGRVIALDSKVSIDGNALFRHPDLAAEAETGSGHPLEVEAKGKGLQYVKLDVVEEAGGRAANFLDAGGGASAESMAEGIAFVLGDPDVKAMLVNIFGGITRCDDVARGVLGAIEMIGDVPQKLVVRLDGTNAAEGRAILSEASLPNLVTAEKMLEAAEKVVELAGTQGGQR